LYKFMWKELMIYSPVFNNYWYTTKFLLCFILFLKLTTSTLLIPVKTWSLKTYIQCSALFWVLFNPIWRVYSGFVFILLYISKFVPIYVSVLRHSLFLASYPLCVLINFCFPTSPIILVNSLSPQNPFQLSQ
jgi:hypothetical protein